MSSAPSSLSVALAAVGIGALVVCVAAAASYFVYTARRRRQREQLRPRDRRPIQSLVEEAKIVGEAQRQRQGQGHGQVLRQDVDIEAEIEPIESRYHGKTAVAHRNHPSTSSSSNASSGALPGSSSGGTVRSSSSFSAPSSTVPHLQDIAHPPPPAPPVPSVPHAYRRERQQKRRSGRASTRRSAVPSALLHNLGELPQLPVASAGATPSGKAKRTSVRKPAPTWQPNSPHQSTSQTDSTTPRTDDLASYTPVLDLALDLDRSSSLSHDHIEDDVDFAIGRSMWLASTFQQQQQQQQHERTSLEDRRRPSLDPGRPSQDRSEAAGNDTMTTARSNSQSQSQSQSQSEASSSFYQSAAETSMAKSSSPPPRLQEDKKGGSGSSEYRPLSLGLSMSSSNRSALVASLFDGAMWADDSAPDSTILRRKPTDAASGSEDESEAPSTAATSIHSSQSSTSARPPKQQQQQPVQLQPVQHQIKIQDYSGDDDQPDASGAAGAPTLGHAFASPFHRILYPDMGRDRNSSPILAQLLFGPAGAAAAAAAASSSSRTPTPTPTNNSNNGGGDLTPTQASVSAQPGPAPKGFASSLRARLSRTRVPSSTPSTPSTYAASATEQWIVDTTASGDDLDLVRPPPLPVGLGLGMSEGQEVVTDDQEERRRPERRPSVQTKRSSTARISIASGPVRRRVSIVDYASNGFDRGSSAGPSPWMLARYEAGRTVEESPRSDTCDTLSSCLTGGTEAMGEGYEEAIHQRARLLQSVQANKAKMLVVAPPPAARSADTKSSGGFISHSPRFSTGQGQPNALELATPTRKAPSPNLHVDSQLANGSKAAILASTDVPPTPPYTPVDAVKNAAASEGTPRKLPSEAFSASSSHTVVPPPAAALPTLRSQTGPSSSKLRPLSLVASVAAASSTASASPGISAPFTTSSPSASSPTTATAAAGSKMTYRRKPSFDQLTSPSPMRSSFRSPVPVSPASPTYSTSLSAGTMSSLLFFESGSSHAPARSSIAHSSGLASPSSSHATLQGVLPTDSSPSFLVGPDPRGGGGVGGGIARGHHPSRTSLSLSMAGGAKTLETLREASPTALSGQEEAEEDEDEDEDSDEDLARFRAMKRRLEEMGLHHPLPAGLAA